MTAGSQTVLHATAVAVEGRAVMIRGASGSGKSALALEMMGFGAALVSDDRVVACRTGDAIALSAPAALRGLIEARGVGLLGADAVDEARLVLVVDLDAVETERLPPDRRTLILGLPVPVVQGTGLAGFPAAIVQYLKGGRRA